MKVISKLVLLLALAIFGGQVFASVPVGAELKPQDDNRSIGENTLDATCTLDFIGFTTGTYSGNMTWPGHSGQYYMSGYRFLNSCAPGDTQTSYCVDLSHILNQNPYCANINPLYVNATYPEQAGAMAYLLTWFPVMGALDDRIQQLTLWKLSNDLLPSSPTFNTPWYHVNAGRGYPNVGDTPVYPYVNTVYNSDPAVNVPASDRARYLLGAEDGLAKNVIVCGDDIVMGTGPTEFVGDTAIVPVIIHLNRGTGALAVGNAGVGGVRILLSVNHGVLSQGLVHTDAAGNAYVTVKQLIRESSDVIVHLCTCGIWPDNAIPCNPDGSQQLVLLASDPCCICQDLNIPGDDWLPVELASFSAMLNGANVQLSWQTQSETGLNRWEIERRLTGEANFALLGSVTAANEAQGHVYSFSDMTAQAGMSYDYRLVDVDVNGARNAHNDMIRSVEFTGSTAVTNEFKLGEAFPNPFNPEARIRFSLAESGTVTLKVYDITGHEVATLIDGQMSAGEHTASFNGAALPSGVYFYKLNAGTLSETRRMILMK